MLARPRFVRWRSLHSGSLHITSLFSGVSCWHDDAPGLSRCSDASGCPGPLLAYRFAECSSLLMRQTQTLGDSLARRTWGSDSPLMRLVTFAPRRGACSGRCGPGPAARALFAFGDGQASPRSQPFGPHSSRPERDGQSG